MRAPVLIAVLAVVACGEERIRIRPIIDLPPASSDAYPLDDVDTLKLSVAEDGEDDDIAVSSGTPEAPPRLEDIPFDDDLVLHLSGEFSGVEIAYGRSCPFAVPGDSLEPHIYFSRAVKWAARADPFEPTRTGGHAFPFSCGGVFLGGDDFDSRIEMFDTAIGEFQLLQPELIQRRDTVVAPLGAGRVLIVGGVDPGGNLVNLVEVFNPGAALVEEDVGPGVTEHAAVSLEDGAVVVAVVVAGGRKEMAVTDEAWEFTLNDAGRLEAPEILGNRMIKARAGHTMTQLSDDGGAGVLIVGGRDDDNLPVGEAEFYRPFREEFQAGAMLSIARYRHHAVRMRGGFVLIIGGFNPSPVRELELYDTVAGVFQPAGALSAGAGVTDLTVTRLPDNRVLLTGGRDETGQKVASAHIVRVDPVDGQVTVVATDAMEVPRAAHSAVLLGDGTVLIIGGTDDASAPAERYNPPSQGRR